MYRQIQLALEDWKKSTDERQKLQSAYIAIAVAALLVAGLIALIDNELGQQIAYIALAAVIAFLANAVIWHLVIENVLDKIKNTKKRS